MFCIYFVSFVCYLYFFLYIINKHCIVNELCFEWCVYGGGNGHGGGIGDGGEMTKDKNIMGGNGKNGYRGGEMTSYHYGIR